jgi:Schlafen, AlbA_2
VIPKPLEKITLEDLQALLGRARENKTLEFKRELPDGKAGSLKVLAGVSAMANTAGGDFVIGVADEDGVASGLLGIEVESVDRYKQSLEQILTSWLEPKLPRFDIHEVACDGGRWVFIIRIARSWVGPHRVTSDNHFYVRTSTSTVSLDVADLRTAFGQREVGVERIEAFRRERLARIMTGDTPAKLSEGPVAVLHMAPLPSFVNRDLFDLASTVGRGAHMPVPLGASGGNHHINLLGVCNVPHHGGEGAPGYGQLFRSGAYEGTAVSSIHNGNNYFGGGNIANMIVSAVRSYLALQDHYGFAFPTFAMFSLCNCEKLRLYLGNANAINPHLSNPLGEALVSFPELLIENAKVDVPQSLRPLLNIIWNAFGRLSCDMFDGKGAWIGIV